MFGYKEMQLNDSTHPPASCRPSESSPQATLNFRNINISAVIINRFPRFAIEIVPCSRSSSVVGAGGSSIQEGMRRER